MTLLAAFSRVEAAPVIVIEEPAGTPLFGNALVGWGRNDYGQSVTEGLNGVKSMAAGGNFTMALLGDGTVLGWGDVTGNLAVPAGLSDITAIAAGLGHVLALKSDGTVIAWGLNTFQQTNVPFDLTDVVAVSGGLGHSMALKSDGMVVAWGYNAHEQSSVPFDLADVRAISAGGYHSLALKTDGTVVAWGNNAAGQCTVPVGLTGVQAIAGGGIHTLALKSDGTVVAWGSNSSGQSIVPAGLTNVKAIAAGEAYSVALKHDGTVVAWGINDLGQTTVPTGLAGVLAISAGWNHALALVPTPPVVTFENQIIATTSVAKTFTLKNLGDAALDITSVSVTGGQAADFTVSTAGMLTSIPDTLGETSFTVTFRPSAPGLRSTTLRVLSSDPGRGTYDITLRGSGDAPEISIEQPPGILLSASPTVAFVGQASSTASPAKVFAIKNSGAAPLTISSVTVTGGEALEFNVNTTGMLTTVPALTGETFFEVTFNPAMLGFRSTTLRVLCNDSDESVIDISLNGTGIVAPEIGVEQSVGIALAGRGNVVAWGDNTDGQTSVPAGLASVQAIAAGVAHTVALKSDGTVAAWGRNDAGQINVPAGLTGVTAIEAGRLYTLALRSNGTVVAWGDNSFEQRDVPAGLTGVKAIAAGGTHAVALKTDGTVVAWGDNASGQADIPFGLTSVVAISAGYAHTVALKSDGTVVAWGSNLLGQIVVPPGLAGVKAISAADAYSVAVKSDGTVVAWGDNGFGQTDVPVGLTGVQGIAAAYGRVLAVKSDGTLVAWGHHMDQMNLLSGQTGVKSIAWGLDHTLVLSGTSTVDFGDVADSLTKTFTVKNTGPGTLSLTSVSVTGGDAADFAISTTGMLTSVSPTTGLTTFSVTFTPGLPGAKTTTLRILNNDPDEGDFELTLKGVGLPPEITIEHPVGTPLVGSSSVVGWGQNFSGQTTQPPGLGRMKAIAAGYTHTVALRTNGTVVTWGQNNYGQRNVPAGLTDVQAIAADNHTVALKTDGTVVAWGRNDYGQASVPSGLTGVSAIAAGNGHTMALKSDGTVVAWGTFGGSVPPGLTGVQAIAAGANHSVALKTDGTLVFWGSNAFNEHNAPSGLGTVTAIAAGYGYTMALRANGTVAVWGDFAASPPAGLTGVKAIAGGAFHMLALKTDGTVVAWGLNNHGESTVPGDLDGVVAISGGGSHSLALVAPTPIDFGNQALGSASAPKTFTVKNIGPGQLKIASVSVAGGNAADFTVSTTGMLTSLPPITGVTSFTVTFTPGAVAPRGTTLRVLNNDSDEGIFEIPLIGRGAAPEITIEHPIGIPLAGETSVTAWGSSSFGAATVPGGLVGVKAVAAGSGHAVALKTDGTVIAWGDTSGGRTAVPAGLTGVVAVAASSEHTLALKNDGTVVAWGRNPDGQTDVPAGLNGVVGIAAGLQYSAALRSNGTVITWGSSDVEPPVGLTGVRAIAGGGNHIIALKDDGTVTGWGSNVVEQINIPAGLTNVRAISAGLAQSVALRDDGTVVAWGATVVPAGQTGFRSISAGYSHALGVKTDGTVVVWGSAAAPAGLTRVSAVAVGNGFSLAITEALPAVAYDAQGSPTKTFTIRNTGDAPLNITGVSVIGDNVADFTVNTTGMLTSVPPTNGLTSFTVTFTPGAAGARKTTLRVLSNDADEGTFEIDLSGVGVAPGPATFTLHPESHWAFLGGSTQFAVNFTGAAPVSQQWRKGTTNLVNGTNIAGATTTTLTLSNLKTSDALRYNVRATAGIGSPALSNDALLGIATRGPARVDLKVAGNTTLNAMATVPTGVTLKYAWLRNNVSLGNNGPFSGTDTKTLKITGIRTEDEGVYTCRLTMELPTGNIVGFNGDTQVNVMQKPTVPAFSMPVAMVSESIAPFQIPSTNRPTKFAVTGLPPGVVCNADTGVITGRPTAAKYVFGATEVSYTLKITASNIAGTSSPVREVPWLIKPLAPSLIGTFNGLVDRSGNVNSNLGGTFTATTLITGKFTGSLTLAGVKYPFDGALDTSEGDDPTATVQVKRTPSPMTPLKLTFSIETAANRLHGELDDEAFQETLDEAAIGDGIAGNDNGDFDTARFSGPRGIVLKADGNAIVADTGNHALRFIDTELGVVSLFAGTAGTPGSTNGNLAAALFNGPEGMAFDSFGNLYIADTGNACIRKISTAGVVSTLAGSPGLLGTVNATGTAARFRQPCAIAIDLSNNLIVADRADHTLRKITPAGVVTTLAGKTLTPGTANGSGASARFQSPNGICFDPVLNAFFVADTDNSSIRKVTAAGAVTTYAGETGVHGENDGLPKLARFYRPFGITSDRSGTLFVADSHIIEISPGGVVGTISDHIAELGGNDIPRALAFEPAEGDDDAMVLATDAALHGITTHSLSYPVERPFIEARRNIFAASSATIYKGLHNVGMEPVALTEPGTSAPGGDSYVTLDVSASGTVTVGGKMADNTTLTGSVSLGPDGRVPLHQMLYTGTGSVQGYLFITGTTGDVQGQPTWMKIPQPFASTTRSYIEGWPVQSFNATGGRWATTGTNIFSLLGLTAGTNNTAINFSLGGLTLSFGKSFTITAPNTVTFVAATDNPNKVTLTITPGTGRFSGKFDQSSGRKADFFGALWKNGSATTSRGSGFFVLPGLTPTPTTSDILSGRTRITPN